MLKHLLRRTLLAALFLCAAACARHKIIPDKVLAQIFHDAFLSNAYITTERVDKDSLNIYEPIFARYGYTTSDVQYTIGNFSKRKSARLGDVVELAIKQLETEGAYYEREVAALDTIDNIARRTFTRRVLSDSLVRVRSLRDTARLRFTLDVQPGEYAVRLNYRIDSLDENRAGLRGVVWLETRDSMRSNVHTVSLRRDRTESYSRTLRADSTHRRLHIDFADFRQKPRRPSITLTDLEVDYTLPTPQAVDSLYLRQMDLRIFADEFLRAAAPKDSL